MASRFVARPERDQLVRDHMVAFKDSVTTIAMESDLLCITVHKDGLLSVLEHLRNELGFGFLTTLLRHALPRYRAGTRAWCTTCTTCGKGTACG
jgi:hypothetical protein